MYRVLILFLVVVKFESLACRVPNSSLALNHLIKVSFGKSRDDITVELPIQVGNFGRPTAYLKYRPEKLEMDGSLFTSVIDLSEIYEKLLGSFTVPDRVSFVPYLEVYWPSPASEGCGAVGYVNIRKLP